jgi:hypothetical protein
MSFRTGAKPSVRNLLSRCYAPAVGITRFSLALGRGSERKYSKAVNDKPQIAETTPATAELS